MRDPVERAISSAIQIINSPAFAPAFMHYDSLDKFLIENHCKDFFVVRGDCVSTVNALDSAFSADEILRVLREFVLQ